MGLTERIEAKKRLWVALKGAHARASKLKWARREKLGKALKGTGRRSLEGIRGTEGVEVRGVRIGDTEEIKKALLRLDRLFIEGEISLEEYMRRRRGLTRAFE
jgi:hypothetical protein